LKYTHQETLASESLYFANNQGTIIKLKITMIKKSFMSYQQIQIADP